MALPSDISGLVRWWRGSDLTGGNGAAISSWPAVTSVGGGAALVQATGGNQPTVASSVAALGGQPAALFDGVNDKLAATITSVAQPWTVFAVYSQVAPGGGTYEVVGLGGGDIFLGQSTGLKKQVFNGTTTLTSSIVSPTGGQVYLFVANGASSGIYEGADSAITGTTGNPGASATGTTLSIGDSVATGLAFGGYVAEVGVYNVALSAADRQTLFDYLAQKYGFQPAAFATPRPAWRRDPYWMRVGRPVDPNQFPGGVAFDPPLAGPTPFAYNSAAYLASRRAVPQQRALVSDPNLLATALLEDVLSVAGPSRTPWRRDRYWLPPAPPVKDPTQLTTALLEGPLSVAGPAKTPWRRDRYWTPPGAPGRDPAELTTALLEGAVFFAAPKVAWRRDPYWVRRTFPVDPNEFPAAATFDPTLAGPAKTAWRRDGYWVRPGVPGTDPSLLLSALLEGPPFFVGGPKTPWRRDRYWTPPGAPGRDPAQLASALLEGPILVGPQRTPWRRDGYWVRLLRPVDPAEFPDFDPTLAGVSRLTWRRDRYWMPPARLFVLLPDGTVIVVPPPARSLTSRRWDFGRIQDRSS